MRRYFLSPLSTLSLPSYCMCVGCQHLLICVEYKVHMMMMKMWMSLLLQVESIRSGQNKCLGSVKSLSILQSSKQHQKYVQWISTLHEYIFLNKTFMLEFKLFQLQYHVTLFDHHLFNKVHKQPLMQPQTWFKTVASKNLQWQVWLLGSTYLHKKCNDKDGEINKSGCRRFPNSVLIYP